MVTKKEFWNRRWNKVLRGVGNDFVNELVRTAPVDTGGLRQSIKYEVDEHGLSISMNEYGYYIEFGTQPHIIRVKNKKVLSDGKRFFGKEVMHPGTEPNPFIRTVINNKLRNILYNNIKRHMVQ